MAKPRALLIGPESKKNVMVERREANQIVTTSGAPGKIETDQEHSFAESLVAQLGVPADRIEQFTGALNTAFDNDPKRVIGYLTFKIARQREQL